MIQNHRQTKTKSYIQHIWRMKDAYTCEHVRMTEADDGWCVRKRMTCAYTCEHRLSRNVYVVENEVHFLLCCPLYDNLRNSYFRSEWLNSSPCEQIFVFIMCDKRQESLFLLYKNIVNSFALRTATIEFCNIWLHVDVEQTIKSFLNSLHIMLYRNIRFVFN